MLYIASALTPTPVLASLRATALTDNHTSLVVAKPDRVEVWDVTETGLVWAAELKVWGTIVSIDQVSVEGSRPHIVILLSPPNAHALMVTFDKATSKLVVTSSQLLSPPTPTLRAAEFFSAIVAQGRVALVSLWIGVVSCLEIEIDKKSLGKKKKTAPDEDVRLKFRDNYNINIREHNILHISFLPTSLDGPIVTFLWLTAANELRLQARSLSTASHSFTPLSASINVVQPTSKLPVSEVTDFNTIPFSCPAARRVLPITSQTPDGARSLLVIGDEHTVLYTLCSPKPESPKAARRLSAVSGPTTSPRANARRSPQEDLTSGNVKRRKASMGGSKAATSPEDGAGLELSPVWRIRQGFGTVLAAEILEDHCTGASAIIGDEYGALTAVGWQFQNGQGGGHPGTVQVLSTAVDSTSPPSSLTYLDASHLFVSSAVADSVLLRLPSMSDDIEGQATKSNGKGKQVLNGDAGNAWNVVYASGKEKTAAEGSAQVLERWMNVAPVKDMCAVKDASGSLSHLLLASGASESNSLRIVRSGVGLDEITNILGLDSVERMWSITNSGISQLLLSTPTSTILLQMEPTISIINTSQEFSNTPTLAAGFFSERVVQVTSNGLSLWADAAAGVLGGQVKVGKEIVCAQVAGRWVVIATRGGEVSVYLVTDDGFKIQAMKEFEEEISAVTIFQGSLPHPIIAISTWIGHIHLYSLPHLAPPGADIALGQGAYATSLQLKDPVQESASAQLLGGLSNGTLVTYDISINNGDLVLQSRKSSSLGSQPLILFPALSPQNQDEPRIISIGTTERMSVIFESNARTEFSSVNRKDILAVAQLETSSGPVFAVYSASAGLSLVRVTSLKKLHVQTCDMGSTSTSKLAHIGHLGAVACGTTKRLVLEDGDIEETNWVEIRDESTLGFMASYTLRERELVTSIRSVLLYGTQYLAVGTAVLPEEEGDSWDEGNLAVVKEGRVLLFKAEQESEQWRLGLEMEVSTVGAVYALETIHGFLAVAAGSELVLYSVSTETSSGHPRLPNLPTINRSLTRVSSWASAFVISHLAVIPPFGPREDGDLIVGDGMRSVIVLQVDEGSGKIYDDERDMSTHGVVALGRIQDGGEGLVVADSHANIMTYRLSSSLEKAATFGLHEEVSKFQNGSLVPPSSAPEVITPDVLFSTRDGRLGVIGQLTESAARTLDDLQRNMEREWKGPGEVGWRNWRRAGTEVVGKETVGFVDGDFIQHFLEPHSFGSEERGKVIQGASSHEHISKIGEGGKEDATLEDVVRLLEATASMH
ncbi:hypothetical protein IAR50_005188 [Cryptococcus sp. DSM 104548]